MTAAASLIEAHRPSLILEAALASDSLRHGLTALRSYDIANKGRFYSAMFGLSIGLERVLKLAFMISHAEDNGSFPDNKTLKRVGHDVGQLLEQARKINAAKGLAVSADKLDDPICKDIIGLFSTFANRTRYFNLDTLAGQDPSDDEPLAAWDEQVGRRVVERHYRHTKQKRRTLDLAARLDSGRGVCVEHRAEDGRRIDNLASLAAAQVLTDTKQKYSVWYSLCVVEFCVGVLEALDRRQNPAIYIYEFFRLLHTHDRRAVLRRKNWEV